MTSVENTSTEKRDFVLALYKHLQHRTPSEKEVEHWTKLLSTDLSEHEVFYKFVNSEEYKNKNRIQSAHPPGHYYSPIVDPSTVESYIKRSRDEFSNKIEGININVDKMVRFWNKNINVIKGMTFQLNKENDDSRYYYSNGMFSFGDATMLQAFIGILRPTKIIEIGSGFSSACMLDSLQHFGMHDTQVYCIEPNPDRLNKLIRDEDKYRVKIIQNVFRMYR